MNRKTFLAGMLLVLAVVGLSGAFYAWAATVNYTTPTKDVSVGGLPLVVRFGHTTGTAAWTVQLPTGFIPDHVRVVDDADTSAMDVCEWFYGMTSGTAMHIDGTTGIHTNSTSNGISLDTSTYVLTIGTDCLVDGGTAIGYATRMTR